MRRYGYQIVFQLNLLEKYNVEMKLIKCGQFSKGFKTSQKMTALFIFNDAYFKQPL